MLSALLSVLVGISLSAQPLYFGYTGVQTPGAVEEMLARDLRTNVGSLIYGSNTFDAPVSFTKGHLERFKSAGIRAGVSIAGFLFEEIDVPGSPCDFGAGPFAWHLVPDWEARLALWGTLHGSQLNGDNTAFVIAHEEVNNNCTDLFEVEMLGDALKARFPGIPIAMGWGRTHVDGGPVAQPPPAWIPEVFDLLGFWSYAIYDPLDRDHGKNANRDFYNPGNPGDPTTDYGYLLTHKWPHQEVILVFDAHYQERPQGDGAHQVLGWTVEDLADQASNYWSFTLERPEIVGLYGFHWSSSPRFIGLEELFSSSSGGLLLSTHRTLGCRTQAPPSSWAHECTILDILRR